ADLLTDMVGEFPELQGIMGHYYALHDGEEAQVAEAIEDHYKPRFAGDDPPRNDVGLALALADKLETLIGLFGVGEKPSGDKDPFALRRHALGVIRMLMERGTGISLTDTLKKAAESFAGVPGFADPVAAVRDFMFDRLDNLLREQGFSAPDVDAVLALRPDILATVPQRLQAVRVFVSLPEAPALAAANKRVVNILKKSEQPANPAALRDDLLLEPAEKALAQALRTVAPAADSAFDHGDYTQSLKYLAALKVPVDAFFDHVMVNVEDQALRANRLALLARLQTAMNRVADLSRLAS
ncbi:MAG: glycine--tRNA ligase subunit beta, partial [Thiomonas sp. 13-66-29]